jgi:hypothetical protein
LITYVEKSGVLEMHKDFSDKIREVLYVKEQQLDHVYTTIQGSFNHLDDRPRAIVLLEHLRPHLKDSSTRWCTA